MTLPEFEAFGPFVLPAFRDLPPRSGGYGEGS